MSYIKTLLDDESIRPNPSVDPEDVVDRMLDSAALYAALLRMYHGEYTPSQLYNRLFDISMEAERELEEKE